MNLLDFNLPLYHILYMETDFFGLTRTYFEANSADFPQATQNVGIFEQTSGKTGPSPGKS